MLEVGGNLMEIFPFSVMVLMEGCIIAMTITAKTVMTDGMSPYVFVFYSNVLSSFILLPHSFFFLRDRAERAALYSFPLLSRFFLLGFFGIALSQNLVFVGLSYSSPIVVITMVCCIPAMSFILSIILRTTKVRLRGSSCQAKIIGSILSLCGAILITSYCGPSIKQSSLSSIFVEFNPTRQPLLVYTFITEDWVLGCGLLAAASLSVCIWNFIQLGTVKLYPEVMTIVSFYSKIGTIQCAVVCLIAERSFSAYKLSLNMELLIIVLNALFGSVIRTRVHIWCMKTKGPFYVPMFKPFGIMWATIFGVSLFSTSIHYGSIVAAFVTGIGYYLVMWGEVKDSELDEDRADSTSSADTPDDKVPLLQDESQV